MPALSIVRATIADPARPAAFDDRYRNDHLPWAVKAFGARKAWRCWSDTDPAQHIATYKAARGGNRRSVGRISEA